MSQAGPRVILNDRVLLSPRTGVGHYVAELIAGLRAACPDIRLVAPCTQYLAAGRHLAESGECGPPPPRRSALGRAVLERAYQQAFRLAGKLHRCALYHEPCHVPGPWGGATLTTVHDLSVLRHPEWHPADRVRWYERHFVAGIERSTHVIAVSEFTKRELVELLGVPAARITVIYNSARRVFSVLPRDEVIARLRAAGLPTEYFLYVGTLEPRKNLDGLLAAYAHLPRPARERFALLVTGPAGWGAGPSGSLVRHLAGQVRFLGYQDDRALALLYAGARALVWPSFYEGFGCPPLEAMRCGTPVITSNTSSIPEVVGEAAILVDPHQPEQIAAAMQGLMEDSVRAADLGARGLERSARFSWEACAAAHAELYRRFGDG